jgi:hypothetical protein
MDSRQNETVHSKQYTVHDKTKHYQIETPNAGDPQAGTPTPNYEILMRGIMEDFMSFHLDVEFKSYRILKETALRVDSKQ